MSTSPQTYTHQTLPSLFDARKQLQSEGFEFLDVQMHGDLDHFYFYNPLTAVLAIVHEWWDGARITRHLIPPLAY